MLQIGGNPNSSGLLFQDVPDLNGSGLWGGVVILAAGISAIWNKYAPCSLDSSSECFDRVGFLSFFNERPAFQALAALSMVCGLAIAGLQAWSLMRIWHWSRNMGPWSNCTEICKSLPCSVVSFRFVNLFPWSLPFCGPQFANAIPNWSTNVENTAPVWLLANLSWFWPGTDCQLWLEPLIDSQLIGEPKKKVLKKDPFPFTWKPIWGQRKWKNAAYPPDRLPANWAPIRDP